MQQLASNPRNALTYVGTRALAILDQISGRRPVWEWMSYHLVHFYGRHPNPISARLLPKDRWPAFWYITNRLGRAYNPRPMTAKSLAMFISHQERRAMWQKLLGPTADIRSHSTRTISRMFAEPALSLWLQPLRAHLEGKPDMPADVLHTS